MRSQLEELVKLAKQVRETIHVNKLSDETIYVSTWIRVNVPRSSKSTSTFHSVSFLQGTRYLDVNMYKDNDYERNHVIIEDTISDEELDEIILRSKEDIITFIAKLDGEREERRIYEIRRLRNELAELESDVSTN